MSIWGRLTERMHRKAGGAARTPESEAGTPTAGFEADSARREAMISGEGFTAGAGTGEFPASRTGADEPLRGHETEK